MRVIGQQNVIVQTTIHISYPDKDKVKKQFAKMYFVYVGLVIDF